MTRSYSVGGVAVPANTVRTADGIPGLTSRADGTYATGSIIVDDPAGAYSFLDLQLFTVTESACSQPRLFTGYTINTTVSRGDYTTGAGRRWHFDVADLNFLLHLRVLRGSTAKRPAETASQRVTWLLSSIGLAGLVYDNGLVFANPSNVGESDYRGQYADSVLQDVCVASGGINPAFFVYWDPSAAQASLFYNRPTAAVNDSTLRISNVASDASSVTVAPHMDSDVTVAGDDIYDGVQFEYTTGKLYRQLASTFATYGIHRDAVFTTDRISSPVTASAHADIFLVNHSGAVETITLTVQLTAAQVNLIEAGMRIQARFSHLPGYTSFTWLRISGRTVLPTPGDTIDLYDVQLELSNRSLNPGGGGNPGNFPHTPCTPGASALVQSAYTTANANSTIVTLAAAPTVGNVLAVWVSFRGNGGPYSVSGFTDITGEINPGIFNGQRGRMYYRIVAAGDPSTVTLSGGNVGIGTVMVVVELAGVDTLDTFGNNGDVTTQPATMTLGTLTPSAGKQMILLGGVVAGLGDPDTFSAVPVGSAVEIRDLDTTGADTWVGYQVVASSTASYSMAITPTHTGIMFGYAGALAAFICSGSDNPPTPGEWFYDVIPTPVADGTTKTFTLPAGREFADGSLIVKVDRLDQTAAVTAYDGALRTFTLAFAPKVGELVEVSGQGR